MLNLHQAALESPRELIDHLKQLLLDSLEYISDIVLPIAECLGHHSVLSQRRHAIAANRTEIVQVLLVAIIDVVDLFLVDKALDALVDLLLV